MTDNPVMDRVQTEYDELVDKIGKLEVFLDHSDRGTASPAQVALLIEQLRAMCDYRDILKARLGI
jgi:hypothetical protein